MPASGQHNLASRFPPFDTNEKNETEWAAGTPGRTTTETVNISAGLVRPAKLVGIFFSLRKNMESPDVGAPIMEK